MRQYNFITLTKPPQSNVLLLLEAVEFQLQRPQILRSGWLPRAYQVIHSYPLSYVFLIGQEQRLDFVLQVVYLILSFIPLAGAMVLSEEPHLALAAFSIAGIGFYSLSLWKSWQISKGSCSEGPLNQQAQEPARTGQSIT